IDNSTTAAECCSCFFFSSRRRHTRFSRDWSSDVCSSDLWCKLHRFIRMKRLTNGRSACTLAESIKTGRGTGPLKPGQPEGDRRRSEERRVGKEGRSRWGRKHCRERGSAPKANATTPVVMR